MNALDQVGSEQQQQLLTERQKLVGDKITETVMSIAKKVTQDLVTSMMLT